MITFLFLSISVIFYSLIYYSLSKTDDFSIKNEPVLPIYTNNTNNKDTITDNQKTQNKTNSNNLNYFDLLYFSVITQTTIGYGEIVPKSRRCRLIVIAQVFTSLAILELALEKIF